MMFIFTLDFDFNDLLSQLSMHCNVIFVESDQLVVGSCYGRNHQYEFWTESLFEDP
jgi:hypothetical protein